MASLKGIDQKVKDCVNGYIRQCQTLLPKENPYYNIPELVVYSIILFYYIGDAFDPNYCSASYRLSNDNSTVLKTKGDYTNAFLTKIVSKGIHKWRFKINKMTTGMIIGVWKAHIDKDVNLYLLYEKSGKYYGWDMFNISRNRTPEEGAGGSINWGVRCFTGDIVEMKLDLNKLQLSYFTNGKPQGIAFENMEQCSYTVAMYMYYDQDSIELLSYEGGQYQ